MYVICFWNKNALFDVQQSAPCAAWHTHKTDIADLDRRDNVEKKTTNQNKETGDEYKDT
jgi:hypothetical protein